MTEIDRAQIARRPIKPYVTVHIGSGINGRIVTDYGPKARTATCLPT